MAIRRVRTLLTGVAGSPWYSNIYFDADGVTPDAAANVVSVDDMWTAVISNIANDISWVVEGNVSVLDETDGKLIDVESVTQGTGTGTSSGDMLPFTTQGLIQLQTSTFINGRRVRGRVFVPGLTEDASTNGVPISGMVTNLIAAGNALWDSDTSGALVWARPFAGSETVEARAGSKAPITAVAAWNKWAVMRSRRD